MSEKGANLNAKDHKNWTPLHFAVALGRAKCFEILLAAGADQGCQNHLGGTIKDIVRCLKSVEKSDDTPIGLIGEDGKLLTYGDFKKVTGATHVRETHLSVELMWRQWENDAKPHEFQLCERFAKEYRNFCDHPPVHQLKRVTSDSHGNPLIVSPGLGLYATRDYTVGELAGEYKGLYTDGSLVSAFSLTDDDEYGVDAKDFRNDMPHTNDGFPNILLVPVRGVAGLSTRDIFVVADQVKAGEQLCSNYGFIPYLKAFQPYVELRAKEAREFVKAHSVQDLMQCFYKVAERDCTFDDFIIGEKFRYFLETPAVIYWMLLDQTLTIDQGKALVQFALSTHTIPEDIRFPTLETMHLLVEECHSMRTLLTKQMPCLLKEYNGWIQSLPARAGIVFTLDTIPKAHNLLRMMTRKRGASQKDVLQLWNKFKTNHLEEIKAHVTKYAKMAFSEHRK